MPVPNDEEIYCIEMTVYDPDILGTKVLRYATKGGVYGGNYYEPRITQPGNFKISLFQDNQTRGQSQVGYGEVVLTNVDGGLDALLNYGCDGRSIVFKKFTAALGLVLLTSCAMEQPVFQNNEEMSIRIRDDQARLSVPATMSKYAGDNVLPDGLEGTSDIKGKPKPLLYGKVSNATPVLVNTSRLIYQIHETHYAVPTAVYDKGVALIAGAQYLSVDDMMANAPAPGTFRWLIWDDDVYGSFFRLGSAPAGPITFDGYEGATSAARTAGQVIKRIISAAIGSGWLITADYTALDALNSAEVGIYTNSEMSVAEMVDSVAGSIGAWYGFDVNQKFRVGRLDAPSGTPDITLTGTEILNIERLATQDTGRGVPVWRVNLNYDKNFTVQNVDQLAGSVTLARQQWLSKEFRTVNSSDNAVRAIHQLAPEMTINTLLVSEPAAQAESDRLFDLYSVRRDMLAVQIPSNLLQYIEPGKTAQIMYNRYGYDSGKLFKIIGIKPDWEINITTLIVWG